MKKTTLCTLIAGTLAPSAALADSNCAHSNSWQCQQRHQTAVQAAHETRPDNVLTPHVAQPGTTTPALGSLPTDHHNVALKPKPIAQATPKPMGAAGSSKPTKKPMPVATPPQVLPPQETPHTVVTVTGTQSTVTGYGPVPQTVTGSQAGFTGYGPVPQEVRPSQTGFTGYGPVPKEVAGTQTGFTGYGPVPQEVRGSQTGFTGYGPVPQPVIVTGSQTGFTGYGPVPKEVTGTQTGFTGYGPVPKEVTGSQTGFTGYGPVPQSPAQSAGSRAPAGQTPRPHNATPVIVQASAATQGAKTPGTSPATHQLVVHEPPAQKRVTSGHHANPAAEYDLEFIEPGIQNHKVEVYRSKDARETVYNDTIPQDHGDFHLVVVGIRNPDYIH
jgi:hypothetical protein